MCGNARIFRVLGNTEFFREKTRFLDKSWYICTFSFAMDFFLAYSLLAVIFADCDSFVPSSVGYGCEGGVEMHLFDLNLRTCFLIFTIVHYRRGELRLSELYEILKE